MSHVEAITDDGGEVIAVVHGPQPLSEQARAAMRKLVDHARAHADELIPPEVAARQDAARQRIRERNARLLGGDRG